MRRERERVIERERESLGVSVFEKTRGKKTNPDAVVFRTVFDFAESC